MSELTQQISLKCEVSGKYLTFDCVADLWEENGPFMLSIHNDDEIRSLVCSIRMQNNEFIEFCRMAKHAYDFVCEEPAF